MSAARRTVPETIPVAGRTGTGVDRVRVAARRHRARIPDPVHSGSPPSPVATTVLLGSVTTMLQGKGSVNRAVKRTIPPGPPTARGE